MFPGYEIIGEIGRGGMGVVYKARQRNLNRLVALKVILGGPLASDEDKARFRIEAEAAARLKHPNIVQVYDVGEHAGFSFMALELIEGETLRQWQAGRPTEPEHAARLVVAVARAIQHAHEHGIVHRDLKPANILLAPAVHDDSGYPLPPSAPTVSLAAPVSRSRSGALAPLALAPKVTDFGLAKAIVGGSDLTVTGIACGTPNYMAPEQVRGKPPAPGVDVYGLGALLYELLAGRPPFVGTDAAEVMAQITKAEPPCVRKLVPGVPRDLAVIVAKCLEKDPARRYATARDAADDLDRFVAGKPITARPVGAAERAWRWVRRNPVAAGFLFVLTLGLLVTGGLAVALARSESEEHTARAGADVARAEAEQARDELRDALATAQTLRRAAESERATAKLEAERAVEQRREADTARRRSEADLRVAGGVIRDSLRELARLPHFEEPEYRGARLKLLASGRNFRDAANTRAPDTEEWLDLIADVSHWLGFLEFLNDNQPGAAAEYRAAADAAARWATRAPKRTEARARQADSLVNAGNALVNAGRHEDAEACYREAVALLDAVVAEAAATGDRPGERAYRRHSLDAYGQLANVCQVRKKLPEWEKAARGQLDRARELVRASGDTPDHRAALVSAHHGVGKALAARQQWDEAEKQYADAIALREAVRDARPDVPQFATDYTAALTALAGFQYTRGDPKRAEATYARAVASAVRAAEGAPEGNEYAVDVAAVCAVRGLPAHPPTNGRGRAPVQASARRDRARAAARAHVQAGARGDGRGGDRPRAPVQRHRPAPRGGCRVGVASGRRPGPARPHPARAVRDAVAVVRARLEGGGERGRRTHDEGAAGVDVGRPGPRVVSDRPTGGRSECE